MKSLMEGNIGRACAQGEGGLKKQLGTSPAFQEP